jgi:hypothetical protein
MGGQCGRVAKKADVRLGFKPHAAYSGKGSRKLNAGELHPFEKC